jgi:hypothetical protein
MERNTSMNEIKKNPKTNFMLSAKRTKINWTSDKEIGGKYKFITGHLAYT